MKKKTGIEWDGEDVQLVRPLLPSENDKKMKDFKPEPVHSRVTTMITETVGSGVVDTARRPSKKQKVSHHHEALGDIRFLFADSMRGDDVIVTF